MARYCIEVTVDEFSGDMNFRCNEHGKRLLESELDGSQMFGYQVISALVWQDVTVPSGVKENPLTSPVGDVEPVKQEE